MKKYIIYFVLVIGLIVVGFLYFNSVQGNKERDNQIQLVELVKEYDLRMVDLNNAKRKLIAVSEFHLLRSVSAQNQVNKLFEKIENIKFEIRIINPNYQFKH